MPRLALRTVGLGYLMLLLALPLGVVGYQTFRDGLGAVWQALSDPNFIHALKLTLIAVGIAVPANTVFGIVCALALVRRGSTRGNSLISAAVAVPLALSPIVVGLALVLVYGQDGWLGSWLIDNGIRVIFSVPGIVLATIVVSLPFVVREVVPVLRELGDDQEQAAWTLGASRFATFWRITLPSIRWGVVYGVVLTTARSLGEFGAVAVVSGRVVGSTETLTLHVEERLDSLDTVRAYTTAVVLALLALSTLLAMNLIRKEKPRGDRGAPGDEAVR